MVRKLPVLWGDKVSNLKEPESDGGDSVTFPFAVQTQLKKIDESKSVLKVPCQSRVHVCELLAEPDCFPAHLAQHLASAPKPTNPRRQILELEMNSPLIPYQGKFFNKGHLR